MWFVGIPAQKAGSCPHPSHFQQLEKWVPKEKPMEPPKKHKQAKKQQVNKLFDIKILRIHFSPLDFP